MTTGATIVRLKANGTLDTSFDGDGIAVFAGDNTAGGIDLAIKPDLNNNGVYDPKYLLLTRHFSNDETLVFEYKNNGSINIGAFGNGSGGFKLVPPGAANSIADKIAVDANGRILLGITNKATGEFYFYRMLPNGTLDETFAVNGQYVDGTLDPSNIGFTASAILTNPPATS